MSLYNSASSLLELHRNALFLPVHSKEIRDGIFKKSVGARNQVGIGLSYRPARPNRLAEFIPWNQFLGSMKNTGSDYSCALFAEHWQKY